jgi:protein-S-isoprenylcysteine O-methyltransferase
MQPLHVAAIAYGCAEVLLAWSHRSGRREASGGADPQSHDQGTLVLLWIAISASIAGAIAWGIWSKVGAFDAGPVARALAWCAFASSVALRAWSIVVLGRHFTVDVAIHRDHELIASGPYRVLRHPSYTGVVGIVAALGFLNGNVVSLALATVGVTVALVHRIRVEERALASAFGDAWTKHCERTWRLVPFVW